MTDSNNLKVLAIMTAINTMFKEQHFSICVVDRAIKGLNVVPDHDAYETLRQLHCINYHDMPRELLKALPGLVAQCTFLCDAKPSFGDSLRDRVSFMEHGEKVTWLRIGDPR